MISGVMRDSTCVYVAPWQSHKCFGLNYRMLAIESLDADTETRRLSPVAVLGDGYIDLMNGMLAMQTLQTISTESIQTCMRVYGMGYRIAE